MIERDIVSHLMDAILISILAFCLLTGLGERVLFGNDTRRLSSVHFNKWRFCFVSNVLCHISHHFFSSFFLSKWIECDERAAKWNWNTWCDVSLILIVLKATICIGPSAHRQSPNWRTTHEPNKHKKMNLKSIRIRRSLFAVWFSLRFVKTILCVYARRLLLVMLSSGTDDRILFFFLLIID